MPDTASTVHDPSAGREHPIRVVRTGSRYLWPAALSLAAVLALASCKRGPSEHTRPRLRLSMIPATDPGKMIREGQPLVSYLEKETGAKVEMTIPTNYAAVVEAAINDKVDIAHFGGFTYVQASARAGVKPLVQRDRDLNFHSVFLTQPKSPIRSLADLKGHRFAFGDVNSTSGHLMPEYFMREAKVDPQVIAKAVYTGGHDATALAVANKKVDAGAMDELVYNRMMKEGKINESQVRVFYTTPPFMDYVWAARRGLDPKLAEAFSNALLKLDANQPQDKVILDFLSASRYVRAEDRNYDKLRQAARDAGLLK
ncbi:MAG TPA: putative selenate ABC transporter substrate-binding protein [Candidatus Acidoferrales bacterium]|nr:putative selenate ABC transporter substrate-binding protein [Candidatus Acidoferrales bacterium]